MPVNVMRSGLGHTFYHRQGPRLPYTPNRLGLQLEGLPSSFPQHPLDLEHLSDGPSVQWVP